MFFFKSSKSFGQIEKVGVFENIYIPVLNRKTAIILVYEKIIILAVWTDGTDGSQKCPLICFVANMLTNMFFKNF